MAVRRKKLLVVTGSAGTPLAAFAPLAERQGWQVIVAPDWTHAKRKLARAKVVACVSDFPQEGGAGIRDLLGSARWVIFGTSASPDAVKDARASGVAAVFLVGHATPGAILKSLEI